MAGPGGVGGTYPSWLGEVLSVTRVFSPPKYHSAMVNTRYGDVAVF